MATRDRQDVCAHVRMPINFAVSLEKADLDVELDQNRKGLRGPPVSSRPGSHLLSMIAPRESSLELLSKTTD